MSNERIRLISPLAGLRRAADQQRVAAGIGCDLATVADERLQHLGKFFGRRIAQRHRLGRRPSRLPPLSAAA